MIYKVCFGPTGRSYQCNIDSVEFWLLNLSQTLSLSLISYKKGTNPSFSFFLGTEILRVQEWEGEEEEKSLELKELKP